MAHEFRCDRCKQLETVERVNKWTHEHTSTVDIEIVHGDGDSIPRHELCHLCTLELRKFLYNWRFYERHYSR